MIDPADKHRRRSIRLKGYDYSTAGAYFVTVCTWQRECLFGELTDGAMRMNDLGQIVEEAWFGLSVRYPEISLDAHVIMPNHFHGLLMISKDDRIGRGNHGSVGAIHELPLQSRRAMILPKAIGYLKMNSAKRINHIRSTPGVPVWQRNYYERIIRDERECSAIRQYIAANPATWIDDENHPAARDVVSPRRGNS